MIQMIKGNKIDLRGALRNRLNIQDGDLSETAND